MYAQKCNVFDSRIIEMVDKAIAQHKDEELKQPEYGQTISEPSLKKRYEQLVSIAKSNFKAVDETTVKQIKCDLARTNTTKRV